MQNDEDLGGILKSALKELEKVHKLSKQRIEQEKRYKELRRNFHLKQISFLEHNKNRRFEITLECYNAALRELKKSFQWGEEMGMLIFFREQSGVFHGDEFYDSDRIIRNFYGHPTPFKIWIEDSKHKTEIPYPLGSFGFDYEKIYELAENCDGLLITCHTHPYLAIPSEGDLKEKPYCGIIIGFERTSDQLKNLVHKTFYKKPKWKKEIAREEDYIRPPDMSDEEWQEFLNDVVGKEVGRRIPFHFSEKSYNNVLKECSPTVRLFYTNNGELKRIPLYVDGRELK
jgi:hypothetical protein